MKKALKQFIIFAVLMTLTIGYADIGGDLTNPQNCSKVWVEKDTPVRLVWVVVDEDGKRYADNLLGREWIQMPPIADVNIYQNLYVPPDANDLGTQYFFEGIVPAGTYTWTFRDYDSAGNEYFTTEKWTVLVEPNEPDTTPPTGGCSVFTN